MKKTTVVMENVQPLIDCGHYAVKRAAGQTMRVTADVFKDGHDVIAVVLKWRKVGSKDWRETAMKAEGNDAWSGVFPLAVEGDSEFTIEAWQDAYATWREEFSRRHAGGQEDLSSEILEGVHLLEAAAHRAGRKSGARELRAAAGELKASGRAAAAALAAREDVAVLVAAYPDRSLSTEFRPFGRVTA